MSRCFDRSIEWQTRLTNFIGKWAAQRPRINAALTNQLTAHVLTLNNKRST